MGVTLFCPTSYSITGGSAFTITISQFKDLLEEDTIYYVTLIDVEAGAVKICDVKGVNVAASMAGAQFEDAESTGKATSPSASDDQLAGNAPTTTASDLVVVQSTLGERSVATPSAVDVDVVTNNSNSASDFQLPVALVGCVPKLPLNAAKKFDLSEVESPISFYVSLHDYATEVEVLEDCLSKADTFPEMEVWLNGL